METVESVNINKILSQALTQSETGVLLSDIHANKIMFMNQAAEVILNISQDRLINISLSDAIKDNVRHVDKTPYIARDLPIVRAVKNNEIIKSEEILICLPDGKERWIMVNANPVKNSQNKIIAGMSTFTDITSVKALELKNKEFGIKFQQAKNMESISSLAGGIAHQVNNALFEITGSMELLKMKVKDEELLGNFPEIISNATQRITTLTRQLLAYSRGGKYRVAETTINEIVENALPHYKKLSDSDVSIISSELTATGIIEADAEQLEMVMLAILTNAFESISANGQIAVRTYDIDTDSYFINHHPGLTRSRYSCLTIEDNGKGMMQKIINNIFKPFYTTNFTGRGLGMAAVYGIVKNHQGWIDIDSKPGIGTVVSIYLPVKNIRIAAAENHTDRPASTAKNTILLVEDESSVLSINKEMIEYVGYKTVEAKSGKEALSLVCNPDLNIAIIDVDLADMNFRDLLGEIKQKRPEMTVFISSVYPAEDIRWDLNIHATQILQKPFSLTTLIIKLNQHLKKTSPISFTD